MILTYAETETLQAEAQMRLAYSTVSPFMYRADLTDCPPEVREILREIDKDMALDEEHPHAIENWQEL